MSTKKLITISPTRFLIDNKGNEIAVYRGGIRDSNKYARKTPLEKEMEANLGNRDYKPAAR